MSGKHKTEKPTPKHRRDVEQKGNVPRSREVSSALVLAIVVLFVTWQTEALLSSSLTVVGGIWTSFLTRELTPLTLRQLIMASGWNFAALLVPFLGVVFLAALAGRLVQGPPVFSVDPLTPKLEKISPAKNLKRIFSSRAVMELAKMLALVAVLGWLSADVIQEHVVTLLNTSAMPLAEIMDVFAEIGGSLGLRAGLFLTVVAILDLGFQKYKFEKDIRQTRQEVREDLKQTEGDPLVRQRIRRQQREIATRRMMEDVKKADVVVTNPTHYAVALAYRADEMAAPRVTAKGRGFVALRIREIAEESDVPILENPALARALYQAVAVGAEIPEELYRAVAQILAFVYKQKHIKSNNKLTH